MSSNIFCVLLYKSILEYFDVLQYMMNHKTKVHENQVWNTKQLKSVSALNDTRECNPVYTVFFTTEPISNITIVVECFYTLYETYVYVCLLYTSRCV